MPWTGPPPPPDWAPFDVVPAGARAPGPRSLAGAHGVTDRMRVAAFAEQQARDAFRWGARTFDDAPDELRAAWRGLADEEGKHLGWLLERMAALGAAPDGRRVSAHLFAGLTACRTAHEFAWYMAEAEDRGRVAGERFAETLAELDPISAALFARVAAEEADHIAIARSFFPTSDRGHPR